MKSLICTALVCFLLPLALFGQASGFRAQGRYYSAKEAYEKGQHAQAAQMLLESREFLGGKSNIRLQYLLVRSLYNAGQFKAAQAEMAAFFKLEETRGEERQKIYQNYPQDVDQLSPDETREISILIDKIDREVANDTEGKKAAAAQATQEAAALQRRKAAALEEFRSVILGGYTAAQTPFPDSNTEYGIKITTSGSFNSLQIEFLGRSSHVRDRGGWGPKRHDVIRATIDLARISSFRFVSTPPPMQRYGRAANGRRVSYYSGSETPDLPVAGSADGPLTCLHLTFTGQFQFTADRKHYQTDGRLSSMDSSAGSSMISHLAIPILSEADARRAMALVTALSGR